MPVLFHSTLQLKCIELGDPEPKVTWTNNGTEVANNNTLVITNVTFKDAGQYGCVAKNRAGYISGKIWIDVIGKSAKSQGTHKNCVTSGIFHCNINLNGLALKHI